MTLNKEACSHRELHVTLEERTGQMITPDPKKCMNKLRDGFLVIFCSFNFFDVYSNDVQTLREKLCFRKILNNALGQVERHETSQNIQKDSYIFYILKRSQCSSVKNYNSMSNKMDP